MKAYFWSLWSLQSWKLLSLSKTGFGDGNWKMESVLVSHNLHNNGFPVFISTFCLYSACCSSKLSKCHSSPISQKISTVNKEQDKNPLIKNMAEVKTPGSSKYCYSCIDNNTGRWLRKCAVAFNTEEPIVSSATQIIPQRSCFFVCSFALALGYPKDGHHWEAVSTMCDDAIKNKNNKLVQKSA